MPITENKFVSATVLVSNNSNAVPPFPPSQTPSIACSTSSNIAVAIREYCGNGVCRGLMTHFLI